MMKQSILLASVALAMCCGGCSKSVSKGEYEMAPWPYGKQCAVTFTFDDGCPNQLTAGIPIFEKYNCLATFYLVKDWVGGNWAPWDDVSAKGHEIACHTVTHPNLYELSDEAAIAEIAGCQEVINANIKNLQKPTFAYPYCATPKNTQWLADNYIACRICDKKIESATPADFLRISSFPVGSETPLINCDSLVQLFEKTKAQGGWCTLLYHELDEGTGYSPFPSSELDKTLAYLTNEENSDIYWVETFSEVAQYIKTRNTTTIEETKVTDDSFTFKITSPDWSGNQVLTIVRNLPEGWTDCAFETDDAGCCEIVDGKIIMTCEPGVDEVTIVKL